ncbi:dnaJ homolog subfamily C member 16 [Cydia fagiglandana]|uniref:dnaJ homolog subfamily C member 16 n=1 Tax=Cydia fagiglandana TaxID=1458189 RepID=UPI002FEE4DC0
MQWIYKGWKRRWLWVLLVAALCPLVLVQKIGDPYEILGISRRATLVEIRKAYRQKAKEWHPDKNLHPNAESRFVEIKQAYELLSDTERRQAYDQYGITNEDEHLYKQRHDYSTYARFSTDPFEEFFGNHFRTQDQDITLFHKLSVTAKHFENNIMEKSVHTPALVLFYTDWCFDCVRAAAFWRRLVEALQPLGVTAATVHAGHEASLVRRIGVHGVPCLTLVLQQHVYIYKESLSSMPKILEWIRWKFPYKLVPRVTDSSLTSWLGDFEDNKVKALIFEEQPTMRLRYLLTAFHYRDRVSFGFVAMTARDSTNVTARYKVQRHIDTMVLLKEDSPEPAATVSTTEIPTKTLRELIEANQLLTLPRLSSQAVLEHVCPVEWRPNRRRLCCVLLCSAGAAATAARSELRRLARTAPERLHYAYVYMHAQPNFVQALANGSGSDTSQMEHRVVILWRREATRIQFEWLNETWPVCSNGHCDDFSEPTNVVYQARLNDTKRALEQLVKRLMKPTEVMAYEAHVQELLDEAARGPLWRAMLLVCEWAERAALALRTQKAVSLASVLGTVAVVLAAGYLMAYLIRVEEESVQQQRSERRRQNGSAKKNNNEPQSELRLHELRAEKYNGLVRAKKNNNEPQSELRLHELRAEKYNGLVRAKKNNNELQSELRLHELRAEKYNGLVRLLKPGCRTIVLLVDMQSRVQLLSKFHKIVWPYRKNKTLLFAYLQVERNIDWFRRVLQLSLGGQELRVNARNCVGTVLALNPHRNYFCIYHAKHPEGAKPHKLRVNARNCVGTVLALNPHRNYFCIYHAKHPEGAKPHKVQTLNIAGFRRYSCLYEGRVASQRQELRGHSAGAEPPHRNYFCIYHAKHPEGAKPHKLRVNARNCVGTVLALNPHRNYFCIYHAKHPEGAKPHKRMSRMTRSLGASADPEAGAFIGFTERDSSSDEAPPSPLLQENLLDGLENWLDRLFEGSTHRYYINYWPDMTSK